MDDTGNGTSVTDASTPERSSPLSVNDVFDVLGHHYRRYVLYYLTQCDYAAGVDELIERILAWDEKTTPDCRRQVSTALSDAHLPKLADAGVIEYDPHSQLTTRADHTAILDPYLELAAHDDRVGFQPG